ncbi:hypothetical protein J31TS4_41440 [Paenibacillus sp. J31TS4]|uniref:metallophosphoesterase family protein n=1 Tax=Paenibacillus sp. J31TS4 TaxID=2807195 RepID=UPI001B1B20C6|nr:metallophosphoesterase [Paenibacillus sp. J31TS4]GIP40864.1 hypothetical protein J31TS4_41440 [Paenibacillus sp. J31TS4]
MTRRAFLKWLLASLAVFAGAGWWLRSKLGAGGWTADPAAAAAEKPPMLPAPGITGERTPAPGEPLLTLLLLSDLHINPDLPEHSKHLKQAFTDSETMPNKPDAVILTGDLTDYGRPRDYRELQNVLAGFRLPPVYANMGNHDYYNVWIDESGNFNREAMPNGKTDVQSREAFQTFMRQEKPYREAVVNGYTVLLLSQEVYQQAKPEVGEGAWYSDEQMNWFRERVEAQQDGKPVFVMIHQPLPPAGQNGGSHQLMRAVEFRQIVKNHPNVFVFCGHRHQDFTNGTAHYVKETFHLFHNSAVSRVLNRNYDNQRPEKAQGMYVYVYADRVVLKGRAFDASSWIEEANWTVKLASR